MSDHSSIRQIMQDVGPRDEEILQVLQTGEESWVVRFEHVDVEIEIEDETERFIFSAEVGPVAEERRAQIYESLLLYNMLWRETGGVRMALAEPGGSVLQSFDLNANAVTTELTATVLHNLNERTLIWRNFFEGVEDDPSEHIPPSHPMIQI